MTLKYGMIGMGASEYFQKVGLSTESVESQKPSELLESLQPPPPKILKSSLGSLTSLLPALESPKKPSLAETLEKHQKRLLKLSQKPATRPKLEPLEPLKPKPKIIQIPWDTPIGLLVSPWMQKHLRLNTYAPRNMPKVVTKDDDGFETRLLYREIERQQFYVERPLVDSFKFHNLHFCICHYKDAPEDHPGTQGWTSYVKGSPEPPVPYPENSWDWWMWATSYYWHKFRALDGVPVDATPGS